MTVKILPNEKLIAEIYRIQYVGKRCSYGNCQERPIKSHTIPENYLYKLNKNLRKVLTFQPNLPIISKSNSKLMKTVAKDKFSTFFGFCKNHDDNLFKLLDSFDGKMNIKKATLVHYRNICYGINHIRIQQMRLECLSKKNYTSDSPTGADVEKMLRNGRLAKRLVYCLTEHIKRKKQIEDMIKADSFDKIDYFEMSPADFSNPIFCGRSTYLLHPRHNLFKYPGYSYMPWISYMTLLTETANHLIFCWLKNDKESVNYFLKTLLKSNDFNKILGTLAYGCSDAFAVNEDFHEMHSLAIDECIKRYRLY